LGLNFRFVENGIYDKGKSRTNLREAERIVEKVVKRLKDPGLNKFSIGIVTFNSSQQSLIEDLLDEERRKSPEIEEFFSENNSESLFVKNLENVQGDERDIIIFSVCYGKDINGRMSMNFGPLNKAGGERRLNVAVTRARREVYVYSSIRPDEIDISRTRAVGVKHLKAYLDFAQRGEQALKENILQVHKNLFDSPFEAEVARALKGKGFKIHTQIGCSGYRVDLGVVHPKYPGKYILGIECDGASYHSAKCARERDKLRQAVLESLGWKLHRIWSTDWWHNSEAEIDKAVKAIENALNEPSIMEMPETSKKVNNIQNLYSNSSVQTAQQEYINPYEKEYEEWCSSDSFYSNEQFYSSSYNNQIILLIEKIVEFEGPISLTSLTRKVCSQFEISRATKKAQQRIASLAHNSQVTVEKFKDHISFWPEGLKINDYKIYRKNTEVASRKADDIPPQEVSVAAYSVLKDNISLEFSDLVKATANCFGFTRVGQNVQYSMGMGIEHMMENYPVKTDGEKISLK
jgi:very-short-patch-repair endonuclease